MNIFKAFLNLFKKKSISQPQEYKKPQANIIEDSDKDRFEKAMKFIRVVEGGKFNHPNDPGGFTNMGITQRDYPKLDLHNLTRQQADDIFYKDYWQKSAANKLPYPAYISYFDSVVNAGAGRANRLLQKALNVDQDGKIGPASIAAINKHKNPQQLALDIANNKQQFYTILAAKNERYRPFLRGWTRRTNALKDYITTGSFSW